MSPRLRMRAERRRKKLRQVIDRDGLTCWLCGRPVELDTPHNSKRAASLDHVTPLSEGGTHALDNLRLAHTVCNLRRNRVAQAPALGGKEPSQ